MKTKMMLSMVSAALIIISGCSKEVSKEAHRQALLNTLKARGRAFAKGDIEKVFTFWSNDVIIYPVSEPAVKGIAAVRQYVHRNRQEFGIKPRIKPVEIVTSKSGDLGYIVGMYEWIDREGRVSKPGRYVALWRKNDQAEWKCFLEIHSPKPMDDVPELN